MAAGLWCDLSDQTTSAARFLARIGYQFDRIPRNELKPRCGGGAGGWGAGSAAASLARWRLCLLTFAGFLRSMSSR